MKNEFNPEDWLNKPSQNSDQGSVDSTFTPSPHHSLTPSSPHPPDIHSEVDTIIARIEASLIDITTSYTDWRNVGFAFAHEFGEAGRSFFHRVSRFYHGYTKSETDKQYDQCLKSQGHGITIRTFFHMAREAGIDCTRGRGSEGTTGRGGEGVKEGGGEGVRERRGDQWSVGSGTNPFENSDQYSVSSGDFGESGTVPSSDNSEQGSMDSAFTPPPPHSITPSSPHPLTPSEFSLPTLPGHLFPTLPEFLQRVVERSTSKEERDILLLGSLATLSSCLYKIFGIYDDKKVFPNLYLYVTAKASAGKGRLVLCKKLVQPIHWSLRDQSRTLSQQYEVEMREFNLIKNKDLSVEKPQKPPEKLLFIPANSSSTGMFQLLWDNDGRGLIFETEGDTLAQAFKTDYGNYSDGFRKAFHHETITYYRRTDREYVEIIFPCVSTVLSGTPRQVAILIPNAENGLFSRFMFYYMNLNPVWKNVFTCHGDRSLDEHFNELGKEFYGLYTSLREGDDMEFRLTEQQEEQFHHFFTQVHEKYLLLQGIDYLATIRRLGLNAFRICMILSALRLTETGDFTGTIYCREDDFQSALEIIRILVRHASHVYSELPEEARQVRPKNKQEMFLESLPASFTYKDYLDLAKTLSIPSRTAERYITLFCEKGWICRDHHGNYINKNHSNHDHEETKEE